MEQTTTEDDGSAQCESGGDVRAGKKKLKPLPIVIGTALPLFVLALVLSKGVMVAAMVDGKPVSRLAVIRELEMQGGKQVLESLIDKKLIEEALDESGVNVASEEIDNEMRSIEADVSSQGGTLADALAAQGMTEERLREQILMQKRIETLLAGKIAVSDEEIDAYSKDAGSMTAEGVSEEARKEQVRARIRREKFQEEAKKWVSELASNADIRYFVKYE